MDRDKQIIQKEETYVIDKHMKMISISQLTKELNIKINTSFLSFKWTNFYHVPLITFN